MEKVRGYDLSLQRIVALVVLVAVFSGIFGASMVYSGFSRYSAAVQQAEELSAQVVSVAEYQVTAEEQRMLLESERNTISVVEMAKPGVVQIRTKGTVASQTNGFPSDFSWFFGPYTQYPNEGNSQPRSITGNGSGFVFDTQGHIVTNYHVIEGMDVLEVVLNDGKTYEAKVVGSDQLSDLAVLKIDAPASSLKPLTLADSSRVLVGQKAIAIGSPLASSDQSMGLGRSPSVTEGIVSATDRSMPVEGTSGQYTIEGLIQTDASINPGNSGGPLLNSLGEVIGVNTAIISNAQGIGFAIPSLLVHKNVTDIIAGRAIGRPYMGIEYVQLDMLKRNLGISYSDLGLQVDQGAMVVVIEKNSPADRAGLRGSSQTVTIEGNRFQVGGDIITSINGEEVTGENLATIVRKYSPGDTLQLSILRNSQALSIDLVLASQE